MKDLEGSAVLKINSKTTFCCSFSWQIQISQFWKHLRPFPVRSSSLCTFMFHYLSPANSNCWFSYQMFCPCYYIGLYFLQQIEARGVLYQLCHRFIIQLCSLGLHYISPANSEPWCVAPIVVFLL